VSASLTVQLLLSLIEDYNMVMVLPKNIPTLQSLATKNWTHTDNVFTPANMEELVVVCDTDPSLWGLGTDHVPILTTLDISMPKKAEGVCRNFRETDWDKFRKELEVQLCLIPDPCVLLGKAQFRRAVDDLTKALKRIIEAVVPLSRPSPPFAQMVEQRFVPAEERIELAGQPVI